VPVVDYAFKKNKNFKLAAVQHKKIRSKRKKPFVKGEVPATTISRHLSNKQSSL
jgi:hypothetical protein